jgi:hypothetical protein
LLKKANTKQSKKVRMNTLRNTGLAIYSATVLASAALLIIDPSGLDVKVLILPLMVLLFVSALCFSYPIASKNSNKVIALIGTALLAVLFAILAFFAVSGVAWLVAVSHT